MTVPCMCGIWLEPDKRVKRHSDAQHTTEVATFTVLEQVREDSDVSRAIQDD